MQFTFTPITEADVQAIQSWHYEEPYTVYDLSSDPEDDPSEMLDRRSPYFAVRDEAGTLVGYFGFGTCAQPWSHDEPRLYSDKGILDIGLGMRPDLTGQHLGLSFVNAGLDFASKRFAPESFRLYVMIFNERAIRIYERADFERIDIYVQQNADKAIEFLVMQRKA